MPAEPLYYSLRVVTSFSFFRIMLRRWVVYSHFTDENSRHGKVKYLISVILLISVSRAEVYSYAASGDRIGKIS